MEELQRPTIKSARRTPTLAIFSGFIDKLIIEEDWINDFRGRGRIFKSVRRTSSARLTFLVSARTPTELKSE